MTTEENKDVVRQFYHAFEANDENALKEALSPSLRAYSHGSSGSQNREEHVQTITGWNAAFTGTTFTIEEQLAEGDRVATRVTLRALHNGGAFQGLAPTGKEVKIPGISIERMEDGKIVERRVVSDWLGMMRQLGLVQEAQSTP